MKLFKTYLKKFMETNNYKLEYIAEKTGVSFGLIGHYSKGRRIPSYKFLNSFFKAFKISEAQKMEILKNIEYEKMPEELRKEKMLSEKKEVKKIDIEYTEVMMVPVFSSASAGLGYLTDGETIGELPLPYMKGDIIALKVKGDSMHPTIKNGYNIAVKKGIDVSPGDVGVFLNKSTGETLVKRLKCKNGVYKLESDNKEYADKIISNEEIECVGKVVAIAKQNTEVAKEEKKDPLLDKIEKLTDDQKELIKNMIEQMSKKS